MNNTSSSSWWGSWWGPASPPSPAPKENVVDVVTELDNSTVALHAKRNNLLYQAKKLELEAKDCKDKGRALHLMKRRQVFLGQANTLDGQIANLEQASMTVDSAAVSVDVAQGMKRGTSAVKTLLQTVSVEDIEETRDDLSDQIQDVQQLSKTLGEPLGGPVDEDADAAILAEIASWNGNGGGNQVEKISTTTPDPQIVEANRVADTMPSLPPKNKNSPETRLKINE